MHAERLDNRLEENRYRKIGNYALSSAFGITGSLIGFEIAAHTFASSSEMNKYIPAFIAGGITSGIASRSSVRKK